MTKNFGPGGLSHLVADINAEGDTLYIAVLDGDDSNLPKVLTMSSDLDADATVAYDPQDGTAANVICGDVSDLIWAFGDFGGPRVVRQSDDQGIYWVDVHESTYWTGTAQPAFMGPAEDNLLLVFIDNSPNELKETYFIGDGGGPYWLDLDLNVLQDFASIGRLAVDKDQILLGANAYFYPHDISCYFTADRAYQFTDVSFSLAGLRETITSILFHYNG